MCILQQKPEAREVELDLMYIGSIVPDDAHHLIEPLQDKPGYAAVAFEVYAKHTHPRLKHKLEHGMQYIQVCVYNDILLNTCYKIEC